MRTGAAVAAVFAIFFALSLAWVSLPGLQHDEVLFVNAALPPAAVTYYVAKIQIFRYDIPSMLLPYLGALKGWIWYGIFLLWKPSVYSARVPAVLLNALGLLLFWLWVRRFYSSGTALAALALAATDPTFVYTGRLDWGPVVLKHVLAAAGLLLASRWLARTKEEPGARSWFALRPLAGAAFFLGLALWDKTTFLWFLVALGCALLLLFPRQVLRRLRPAPVAVFVLFFILGALPLVIYNTRSKHTHTPDAVAFEPLKWQPYHEKLINSHLSLRSRFVYGLIGGYLLDEYYGNPLDDVPERVLNLVAALAPSYGTLLPLALGAALLVLPFARGDRKQILFPVLITVFMWLQTLPLVGAGGSAHHVVLAYPMPQLAVAAAGAALWRRARRAGRDLLAFALAVLLVTNVAWNARYLTAIRQTGGMGLWTDACYTLADFLNQRRPQLVVNLDWGLTYQTLLLTRGQVPLQDAYADLAFGAPQDQPANIAALKELFSKPDTLFLVHSPDFAAFPDVRKVFERAVEESGKRAVPVRTFFDRPGNPVVMLLQVEDRR